MKNRPITKRPRTNRSNVQRPHPSRIVLSAALLINAVAEN